jgi:predicted Zn-dependent peptidase
MLFQGSENVGTNEHFELIQRAGGTLNGSTWLDRTNYFETVPSSQLALALWLEADRMGRLIPAMTQEKLDTQREVVKNERRWTVDNQPYGTWWEKLPALTFPPEHPFHHSLIGSMEDLAAASLDDVKEFSRTYYSPDNAVLTIAGDFDLAQARALVQEYFGPFERSSSRPPLPDMTVPARFGMSLRQVVPDNVSLPRIFMACRSPVFGSDGFHSASICSAILGSRKGSRLYRRLVREEQIATAASSYTFDLSKGSDLFVVDVMARPGVANEVLEERVHAAVDDMIHNKVSTGELQRAQAILQTEFVMAMQVAADRADKLSMFATYFGNPALVNELLEKYSAVTVADVNTFAAEYLVRENRATLLYVPRSSGIEGGAQ